MLIESMKVITKISKPEDTVRVQSQLVALLPELAKGKEFDCTIETHREKRSLNANDYSWVLQDQISKALNRRIDDLHKEMVLQYGVKNFYSIQKEALESAIRMFDYYEIKGESEVNGKTFVHVKAGIGTHLYDTKEMAKFLDGVVQEAKDLGIETKTPKELAELKSLWKSGER